MMRKIRRQFGEFILALENKLSRLGLSLYDSPVDHVCYRAGSHQDFVRFLETFKQESVLSTKKFFHEREFYLFVLKKPLVHNGLTVPYLEFSEHGGSDTYKTGFQHIELHTNLSIHEIINGNPAAEKLLFVSKYDREEYFKWPDKVALKVTKTPIITKALLEDGAEIKLI